MLDQCVCHREQVRRATNIAATKLLDERRKQHMLGSIADMPDGDRLCHGDFHPMNILGEASQPVIIDWSDARRGDPAADVCRTYLLMKLHAAENCDDLSRRILPNERYGPSDRV